MEANRYAYQVTPHACDAPQGNFYPHCDGSGCGLNSFRTNPAGFGPGSAYTIDTTRTFTSTTTFVADSQSQLVEVHTQLSQDGRIFLMVNGGTTCRTPGYLAQLSAALQQGMVIAISYWGDQGSSMSWLDSPPCNVSQNCNGTGVSFAAFKVTHF
jgi:cellulose 1,4-beta-cellobiosidase